MKQRIKRNSLVENYTHSRLPSFSNQEISFIRGSHDFFALNHYSSALVSSHDFPVTDPPSFNKDLGVRLRQDPKWKPSKAPWLKVVPWGFRKLLNWIKEKYDNPLVYVTENGYADSGELQDVSRIDYHRVRIKIKLFKS